jgi:signal transduction histidine kinase
MHLFILGVLATQFIYVAVQWWQLRYKEYLYYGSYIGTFIIYVSIIYQQELFHVQPETFVYTVVDQFKRPLALLLYFEYFIFGAYFAGLKPRFPVLHKRLLFLPRTILGFIVVLVTLQLLGYQYHPVGEIFYYACCIFLFIVFTAFITRLWNSTDQLVRYVLKASFCICVGGFITNVIVILGFTGVIGEDVMQYFFLPTALGAAFEIYFFNTGIVYKVSMDEKKLIHTQQQLITQLSQNEALQNSQQQMRNKLAKDLHDDIGSTLSGIALHSHVVRDLISQNKTESVTRSLNLIENGAVEMVNNLNEVVWMVNPRNDNVDRMLERLKEYAFAITDAKGIHVNWKVDECMRAITLPMQIRRHIYLICKEAMNNAVKYAFCNQLSFTGKFAGQELLISICDDGIGFDREKVKQGNGLRNMQERALEAGMTLQIDGMHSPGTLVAIYCEITQ